MSATEAPPDSPPPSPEGPPTATVPPTSTAAGTPAPVLHIPSLGRRITVGALRASLTIVAIVVVPWYLLNRLGGLGVDTPVPIGGIALLGVLFAAVGAIRYISRPTRAFGPLTIVASMVSFAYLLYLIPIASIGIHPGHDVGVAIDFGRFLQYCLIAPVLGMAAGAVTTVEDLARPRERIDYEYSV